MLHAEQEGALRTIATAHSAMLQWGMNLLSLIDWRAVDQLDRLPDGNLPAEAVLALLGDRELLHGVSNYDLSDDPRLEEEVSQGSLWVGYTPGDNVGYMLDEAPAVPERPPTWREVQLLDDGRALSLPGERLHESTISFWQDGHEFDPRASVLSLTVNENRISGFARWRRKRCVETPNPDGTCKGGGDNCTCELRNGLEGTTRIDICKCSEN